MKVSLYCYAPWPQPAWVRNLPSPSWYIFISLIYAFFGCTCIILFWERSGAVGMKVVSVLLGAVAAAGVGSKPTFAKLAHLYFSNIYLGKNESAPASFEKYIYIVK